MKQYLLLAFVFIVSSSAWADGFVCRAHPTGYDYKVAIYHFTNPQNVRKPAVMIVSDNQARNGEQTIAVFSSKNRTLEGGLTRTLQGRHFQYVGYVDSSKPGTNLPNKSIVGFDLTKFEKLVVDVYATYADRLQQNETVAGKLHLVKKNHAQVFLDLVCSRYLKNYN